MSTKHVRTISDARRFRCSIRVDCTFCGNSRTFDPFAMMVNMKDGLIKGLARRMRCQRCGFKQANVIVLPPP